MDYPLGQQIFLSTSLNQSSSGLLRSRRCIIAIQNTILLCLKTKMRVRFFALTQLASSSVRFSFKKESNLAHSSPNMLVEKYSFKFITSIYRKHIFTGQCIHRSTFSPQKRKTNSILTLTNRALSICLSKRLTSELNKIKSILQASGYPEHIIKLSTVWLKR